MKRKIDWPWKDKPLSMTPTEMVHELGQDGIFYWLRRTDPKKGNRQYIGCTQAGRNKWY